MVLLDLLVVLIPIVSYLLYRWAVATYDFFEKRKIPYVKPYPFVGGLWPVFSGKLHPTDAAVLGYNLFPENRFSGFFAFRRPGYLIHDPALAKQIMIKDFDHFTDHMNTISVDVDPIFGRALFFMDGQRWRHGRSGLSPAFTGSKMRNMFTLLSKYVEGAMQRLAQDAGQGKMELEIRDLFQKLGNDIITSISFGVEIDSVHNPNNEFFKRGKQLAATGGFQGLKFFFSLVVPDSVFKLFGIRFLPKEAADFYVDVVSKTIKHREEYKIVRPDFIHLFVQARKNELKEETADDELKSAGFTTVEEHIEASTENSQYTDLDITAVAASFFFGGIETTTTMLCFALYELAGNKEVQQKLQAEIDSVRKELGGGSLTYEVLQKMKYLDMVVTETLRRWPPLGITNRVCVKPYTFEDHEGTKVTIEKGQLIQIPVQSFHRDPSFFPDPYRFDPERFSEENKHKINQDAFLPFGSGPRNCIGSRLALMQAKCLLYYLFSAFSLEYSDKMDVPIKLNKMSLTYTAKNGFWFNLLPKKVAV
ncbi:AAEL001312-PA [Aedes aegypti]|uniref:Cytochrome P450 n=2 Tax=Aedes aegypti TaxID=7159 RepID=Q17LK4_AEDAE|nr:AAEL001312-PA [Aedes aegypti]BAO57716.1 cytochrome P450 [Aedes aegypti]